MSLPPIQDTQTDCERLALIAHLAKAVSADSGRAVTAMTGGSALRLCHGLTRPSFDLDLDVSERKNWLGTIRKAVASSPWHDRATVDRKQGGRGPIRIVVNTGAAGAAEEWWATKVDMRICDGTHYPPLALRDCETLRGIRVRRLQHIVRRKREKLIGKDFREQGRDLYDYAWLVANKPDAVPVDWRVEFRDWVLRWSKPDEQRWLGAIADDRALAGANPTEVIAGVYRALEQDPGLRYRDAVADQDAEFALRTLPSGTVRIGYVPKGGGFVSVATAVDKQEARHVIEAHDCPFGQSGPRFQQEMAKLDD